MGDEAATPPGLFDRIRQMIGEEVAKLLRSGLLRNASISDGGLTIKGGFLKLRAPGAAADTFFVGGVTPAAPDGTPQPGVIMTRNDGSKAFSLADGSPTTDGYFQHWNWYDRAGNTVLADDATSGQGLARPYLPGPFYPARAQDYPNTTATSFETLWRARIPKQQPRLLVVAWCGVDTGSTAEVRVMVNGTQLGGTFTPTPGAITNTGSAFGPAAVAGAHLSTLTIEVQARITSGPGQVQVGIDRCESRQS